MDGQVVEDNLYSDDDLDALPANTFDRLQQEAFRSTQQFSNGTGMRAVPTVPEAARARPKRPSGPYAPVPPALETDALHQPSSDYGDLEDEMLDGEIIDGAQQYAVTNSDNGFSAQPEPGESTQREQWRLQRYAKPSETPINIGKELVPRPGFSGPSRLENVPNKIARNAGLPNNGVQANLPPDHDPTDVDTLQLQIRNLLREREAMQNAVNAANEAVSAKSGEIAIVRANAAKIEREYDSRTKAIQKQHADEAIRQKMEMDRAKVELQKIATEKEFLENDLAEGTKQIKRLQLAIKRGPESGAGLKGRKDSPLSTPRKTKPSYADGFDGAEIQPLSPSELALRGKGGTPKAGGKRKRKPVESSPIRPLQLAQTLRNESFESVMPVQSAKEPIKHAAVRLDGRFEFIQKLLAHFDIHSEQRTIEALGKYKVPTEKEATLATLLYDRILALGNGTEQNLPTAVALEVVSLWSQCMRELYFEPIHLLVDLVQHILLLNPLKTAPELLNSVMGLIQETADVIIIPRCQKKPRRDDAAQISALDCLQVMQLMAQDCSVDTEEITRFWRTVRFDFLMMMLSFVHPLEEMCAAIALLHTSVLEKTFAMIIPPGDGKQDATEARIIDNLSRLLVESPRPTQTEPPLNAVQLCSLRLDVLDLMHAMCERTYGSEALAKHRLVIGRLVRVMNDELDRAYDHRFGHEYRIALVNEATRLLYHLTTAHPDLINMPARLSVIPGGEKKYLIALTRLAFSEGGYLEEGIEEVVVDQAHQMLEMRVSPEEAEQLVEAFASGQSGRRGDSKEPA